MIHFAPDLDSTPNEDPDSATPIVAALMAATFALAALGGAALAGLQSLIGA
jgi:hypothetical protein